MKPPTRLNVAPGQLVDIGGYRLHLHATGTDRGGASVVLIPGAGDFSFDWSLVQPGIARFARVCSYDRAGSAWSDSGPTPRTMRQEAHELRLLLAAGHIRPPYVLVGHSLGGLIARVFAAAYPSLVAGATLVDPTHEDTTLMIRGKLKRVRDAATGRPIPPVQTLRSSPPKLPSPADREQFQLNLNLFGAPRIVPPFDRLPVSVQAMRLWFLGQPPRAASGDDHWADELQALHDARRRVPCPFGDRPLALVLPGGGIGPAPGGIAPAEWKRVNDEKRAQKLGLTALSRRSKVFVSEKGGHHVQLDDPPRVIEAVRWTLAAAH